MMATENGNVGCVKSLLKSGANQEVKNDNEWTALMIAAYYERVGCLQLLLQSGADTEVKNKVAGQH